MQLTTERTIVVEDSGLRPRDDDDATANALKLKQAQTDLPLYEVREGHPIR